MTIEKRLERVEAILDARGLDWDHPRVASDHFVGAGKMVAEEPPKKWRILEPGEVVQEGDLTNAKTNPPSDPPNGLGWIPADVSVGTSVFENDPCVFARLVADEPAKEPEPEHPAGPKPDPGEGYRILSKDPLEDLQEGDEFWFQAKWYRSAWSDAYIKDQEKNLWYRRKIGFLAKKPEPEYRQPVLPADAGKVCEFSIYGNAWTEAKLQGYVGHLWQSVCSEVVGANHWVHARIKVDA